MRKYLFIILAGILLFGFSNNTTAHEGHKKDTVFNTVCPVTGEELKGKHFIKYKEVTYQLCCKRCMRKFDKDPEKYIKNLSKDGKKFIGNNQPK
ncbi:MAG: hypothetical protein C0425_06515 [Chlorobiaceae bacterium]|nr:hypothetical protein [Chlorobiaceae bacterium]MBA4309973.1 hypothetical protein [Chlorobiaceae bacterium]